MIFRDDDISKDTKIKRFKEIHSLFLKYNVLHTIALICKDIEKNMPLIKYMQKQQENGSVSIQIHCWEHYDLTTDPPRFTNELPDCIDIIIKYFVTRPTVLYPPWNKTNRYIDHIAFLNKLEISTQKMSLSGYLKGQSEKVINLHSWSGECVDLEAALKKYTQSK